MDSKLKLKYLKFKIKYIRLKIKLCRLKKQLNNRSIIITFQSLGDEKSIDSSHTNESHASEYSLELSDESD